MSDLKMWHGKLRLRGGRVQGEEIDARIVRASNGAILVDCASGTDATGATRWTDLSPHLLDPLSLCAVILDTKGDA